MFFYEGVNACARRQPTLGIAYFINAYHVDTNFTAARAWEVRAYELAGLTEHAQVAREIHGLPQPGAAPSNGTRASAAAPGPRRVIAILPPVMESASDPAGASESVRALKEVLDRAALADGRVRLFGYEGIRGAVAEQDAQLNKLFTEASVSRYGRWLMADGLLIARVSRATGDLFQVALQVIEPTSGRLMAQEREAVNLQDRPLVQRAVSKIIERWTAGAEATPDGPQSASEFAPVTDADLLRVPAHRRIAAALDKLYLHPVRGASRQVLVHAYVAAAEGRLASLEFMRHVASLDLSDADAPCRALAFYQEHTSQMHGTVPATVPDDVHVALIRNLLARHPGSDATIQLIFGLMEATSRARRWPSVVRYGEASVARFDGLAREDTEAGLRGLLACYHFWYGDALLQVGRKQEAFVELTKAHAFSSEPLDVTRSFTRTAKRSEARPGADFGLIDEAQWAADACTTTSASRYGGLQRQIEKDLALARADVAGEAVPPQAEPAARRDALAGLRNITQGFDREDPATHTAPITLGAQARAEVGFLREGASDPGLPAVLGELAEAFLRRTGLTTSTLVPTIPLPEATRFISDVAGFYEVAAQKVPALLAGSWIHLKRFTGPGYARDLGFHVLANTPCRLEDAQAVVGEFMRRNPSMGRLVEAAIWENIGVTELRWGAADGCTTAFKRALQADPRNPVRLPLVELAILSRPDDPMAEVARLRGGVFPVELPAPPLWEWYNAARVQLDRQQWQTAGVCLEQCRALLPTYDPTVGGLLSDGIAGFSRREVSLGIRYHLAESLAHTGRIREAAELYRGVAAECGDASVEYPPRLVVPPQPGRPKPSGWGGNIKAKLGVLAAERAARLHATPAEAAREVVP